MDNPEKMATLGMQDEEKQSKSTVRWTPLIRKQTQITQLEVKTKGANAEIVTDITTRNSQQLSIHFPIAFLLSDRHEICFLNDHPKTITTDIPFK